MEAKADEPGNVEVPATMASQLAAEALSIWQGALRRSGSAKLTPDQTAELLRASLLSACMEVVQQRMRADQFNALNDQRGRIRVSASVTYTPDGLEAAEVVEPDSIASLWAELKTARDELLASRAQEARLEEELEAAEMALEYTKAEVANLWRVMTTRNLKKAARKAVHELQETQKIVTLAEQRARIRTKVNDVREIARRRRWPWSIVG